MNIGYDISVAVIVALIIVILTVVIYQIYSYSTTKDTLITVLSANYSTLPGAKTAVDLSKLKTLFQLYQTLLPQSLVLPSNCYDSTTTQADVINIIINAVYSNFSYYYYTFTVSPALKAAINMVAIDVLNNTLQSMQTWYYNAALDQVTWTDHGTYSTSLAAFYMNNPLTIWNTLLGGGMRSYLSPSMGQCYKSGDPIVPSTDSVRHLQFGYIPVDNFYRLHNRTFDHSQASGYANSITADEYDCADLCYTQPCDIYTFNNGTSECELLSFYGGSSTTSGGVKVDASEMRSGPWNIYVPYKTLTMDSPQTAAQCADACSSYTDGTCDNYSFVFQTPPICNIEVRNHDDMQPITATTTPNDVSCGQVCLDDPTCDGYSYDTSNINNNCYTLSFQQKPFTNLGIKI
jgi:hypothetical protein